LAMNARVRVAFAVVRGARERRKNRRRRSGDGLTDSDDH